MNELAFFAGAGGGIWGSRLLGWKTTGYVEVDDYAQRVLRARIRDGSFCDAPIFGDIRAFIHRKTGHARSYRGLVDVLTGGFPCQPFSVAGRRLGGSDSRNFWPETIRCIGIVRPRFAFLENVPGLLAGVRYFGTILRQLAARGYDARWDCLPATACGAPHQRDRLWILAWRVSDADREGLRVRAERGEGSPQKTEPGNAESSHDGDAGHLADADEGRLESIQEPEHSGLESSRRDLADGRGPRRRRDRKDLADAEGKSERPGLRESEPAGERRRRPRDGGGADLADSESERLEGRPGLAGDDGEELAAAVRGGRVRWWDDDPADAEGAVESGMGRVVDGLAYRKHRLTVLGEGQVPAVVRAAWNLLRGREWR